MNNKHHLIGTISVNNKEPFDIEYWENYGVICVPLLTSNGNTSLVAAVIKNTIDESENCVLKIDNQEVSHDRSVDEIFRLLRSVSAKFKKP